jgi:chemotaxis protein methyltransferase CheR
MTLHAVPALHDVPATGAARDEYTDFCDGVRRICAIDLLQYKRGQMERRIRTFVTTRGHSGLSEYLTVLRTDRTEVEALLDRVTINVSQLWRHPEQFEVLEKHVLPELGQQGRVRAWSAGCSYGAEAFTLAAVCMSTVPKANVSITGVDIDPRMIERARLGVFTAADARSVKPRLMDTWFTKRPDGSHEALPALRALTRFEVGDLLRVRPRPSAYDLVMCRNTVIYFNDEVRNALHARLVTALRPGGYLVVGATERVSDPAGIGLTPTHPFTYRKI